MLSRLDPYSLCITSAYSIGRAGAHIGGKYYSLVNPKFLRETVESRQFSLTFTQV